MHAFLPVNKFLLNCGGSDILSSRSRLLFDHVPTTASCGLVDGEKRTTRTHMELTSTLNQTQISWGIWTKLLGFNCVLQFILRLISFKVI